MADHRRSPRAQIALPCTLTRRRGSPITGCTRDIGPGGMCVSASRPLAIDELMSFRVPLERGVEVGGRALVLRQQAAGLYALRFEALSVDARTRLLHLAQGRLDVP